MKTKLFYLLLIICSSANAQSFEWGKAFIGTGDNVIRGMATDKDGNSYIAGFFWHTLELGEGNDDPVITSNKFQDIFVAKVNSQGKVLWAKNYGAKTFHKTSAQESDAHNLDNDDPLPLSYANSIALGPDNSLYITGAFQGTVDFHPEGESQNVTSNGFQDIFVLKLSTGGDFKWVRAVGSHNYEEAIGVTTDKSGSVYVNGYYFSDIDFDPSTPNQHILPASGNSDGYIWKLDKDGNFGWVKRFGDGHFANVKQVNIAENGNIMVLGDYAVSMDLNPNDDGTAIVNSLGRDTYLSILDETGKYIKSYSTYATDEFATSEAIRFTNDQLGNTYVVSNLMGKVNFAPNHPNSQTMTLDSPDWKYSGTIFKLSASGEPMWATKISNSDMSFVYDVTTTPNKGIFITGFFANSATFGNINITQQSSNSMDAYVAQINENGQFVAANAFGGNGGPDGHEIETDAQGSIYLASSFLETVNLDPYGSNEIVTSDDNGYRDIYIIKISPKTLGVSDVKSSQQYNVYPNPASDFVYIKSKQKLHNSSYQIYNVVGSKVMDGIINDNQQIEIKNLVKGIYFLQIDNQYQIKLIKN